MRFASAHKVTTYLMVGFAYLALITSGELSDVAVILSLIALPVSWLWEPPRIRFERYSRLWTAITVVVFVLSVLMIFSGIDVLLSGSTFLIYLTVNKLFNRRSCKDYQQCYVLAFLMVVAGTVLNGQLSFGILFLGFVVSSTWALILFHLRREMEDNFLVKHSGKRTPERVQVQRILDSRRIVGRSFFVGTSMVSLSIFLAATVLFLLIPRIGFGLFFQKSRAAISMTGFSDGVQLGGHGLIKNDDTVVMRVQIGDKYHGRNAPYIHWRGVAFDRYENGEWRRSSQAPLTRRHAVSIDRSTTRYYLLYDQPDAPPADLSQRIRRAVRQEIYLEPTGYDVLFGASMPVAFELGTTFRRPRKERNDELRYRHGAGIKYVVYSALEPPSPQTLRAASSEIPASMDAYLLVPDDIPARVKKLAETITAGKKTNYDRVKAIETYLRTNLRYTLEMKDPGEQEPVDFFLFERRAGHCEYFSSAMAILVRELGIPSRNVNGFLGGEWNEYNDYIAVRAGDAHSWVEVYFSGVGWVTFDPTPAASVDRMGRGGLGLLDRLRRLADTARFKWFKWVVEYDLYRQLSLFRQVSRGLRRGAGNVFGGGPSHLKAWVKSHRRAATGLLSVVAALSAIGYLMWRRRHRRAAPAPRGSRRRPRRSPPTALARVYRQVLARFARRGFPRTASDTPREHARQLADRDVPGAGALIELTELYYATELGGRDESAFLERARALERAIAAELGRMPRTRRRG